MLAPSLGEAWPSSSPQVVSLIVHDASLPLVWASLGGRCPRCVAWRPHAYFAISFSDYELFLSLTDGVISTSYCVHFSGKVFELVPIPGYFFDGYIRYPGKY